MKHPACKRRHIGDAGRMRQVGKHRGVIRRIPDEHALFSLPRQLQAITLAHEQMRHAELVVLAEPAVDVDGTDLRCHAGRFHQSDDPIHVGIRKGETSLLDKVNDILRAARKDGTLEGYSQKWLGRGLGNIPE